MSLQQIQIQGVMYDHTSVRVNFNSQGLSMPLTVKNFIKTINWGHQVDSQLVHGVQLTPLGSTLGPYHGMFDMTIIKEGWDLMMSALGNGYFTYEFDSISISYINSQAQIPAQTNLYGCRIIKVDSSSSQGGKELEVKLGFIVGGVVEDNNISPIPLDQDTTGGAIITQ
jgi:hypothetical protein